MPIYDYQCECGVMFEASAPMSENQKSKPCPSCGKLAARKMPKEVSGVFHQETEGIGPQNTGISQLDAHIDRVIGQSAKKGWEIADARKREKEHIRKDNPGTPEMFLSRNPDGTYRPLKRDEQGVYARAFTINKMAMDKLKQQKPESEKD